MGSELIGNPILIAARKGAEDFKAMGGEGGGAGAGGREEGEVARVGVDSVHSELRDVGAKAVMGGGHGAKGAEGAPGEDRVSMLGVNIVHVPADQNRGPDSLGDHEGEVEGHTEEQGAQGATLFGPGATLYILALYMHDPVGTLKVVLAGYTN